MTIRTIPECPATGQRYAEQAPGCDLWHLMDWQDGRLGVAVPYLSEQDACRLIYCDAAVAALSGAAPLVRWANIHGSRCEEEVTAIDLALAHFAPKENQ